MAVGNGYIQEFNQIDGNPIDADLFNNEYGLLNTAFKVNAGHQHNGNPGNGAFVSLLSDYQNLNTIEVIGGNVNIIEFSSNFEGTKLGQLRLEHGNFYPVIPNDLNFGNFQNRIKNSYVQGTGSFGSLQVGFTDPLLPEVPDALVNITDIYDDDAMADDSDTALATQQSIKQYVTDAVLNSVGIFVQSEYNSRESDLASTGASIPYITQTINNVQINSSIHVHATITAEALSANTSPAGNIYCNVTRDGTPLMTSEAIVISTTNDVTLVGGTVTLTFRDDNVTGGTHTYALTFREQGLAISSGKATSGTLLLLEEPNAGGVG